MDASAVTNALSDFVRAHRTTFSEISGRQSQLLELAAVVAVHSHYASNGYQATVRGADPNTFVVKTGTRGHPARYSKIVVEKQKTAAEIHMNLLVRSAHDEGIYCVDVGVTIPGAIPDAPNHKQKWLCIENDSLITFAEAKRLVIYPMLLAQFVGIVHEIKPTFLRAPAPAGFDRHEHLPPTLIALGHFSGNSNAIARSYANRSILVCIAESFDVRLACHRKGECRSPLFWDEKDLEGSTLPTAGLVASIS